MGKTAPIIKKGGASVHSRAAKRASSPGIDLDKSLKDLKPVRHTKTQQPSVLAIHQGAGVTKRKGGRKTVLSAKAKRRQEKGMDRAEAVMDKKETKVQKSKGKSRTIQERSKNWDEMNKKAQQAKEAALALQKEEAAAGDWIDDDGEDIAEVDGMEDVEVEQIAQTIPLPQPDNDEDDL